MSNLSKKTAMVVGDTREFHMGSYANCKNLKQLIATKYKMLGFAGGKNFKFHDRQDFIKKIRHSPMLGKIRESDVIFCHGEGFLEPGSPYGKALFYLAEFIKDTYKDKKVFLINFSCYDPRYGKWHVFDNVVPRDYGSYNALKNAVGRMKVGFDCAVREKIPRQNLRIRHATKDILLFRGRKEISEKQIRTLRSSFSGSAIIPVSSFWKFNGRSAKSPSSIEELLGLLSNAYLTVSSSFHGIVFSALSGVPFIPLSTRPIPKNESVARDILGIYFEDRNLEEWIDFFRKEENYAAVRRRLREILPVLRKRTANYL